MPVTEPDGLRLHEAMVVAMIRHRRWRSTAEELAAWNEVLGLYRQENGDWPDPDQVRLRALKYPAIFSVSGSGRNAEIELDLGSGIGDTEPADGTLRSPRQLAQLLRESIPRGQSSLIAIDGAEGVGKTHLADLLAYLLHAAVLHLDHFLVGLPPEHVDYKCLDEQLIRVLQSPRPVIIDGVCALDVLNRVQHKPVALVYVKRLEDDNIWYDYDACDFVAIKEREAREVPPPPEGLVGRAVYDYHKGWDPVGSASFTFAWPGGVWANRSG